MDLLLIRRWFYPEATIGTLYVMTPGGGFHECYTLEDPERLVKIPGKTGIPRGTYEVTIDWSNRFKRWMPHVLNVPGFEGIRIHAGNTVADTDGCILCGVQRDDPKILQSKIAFDLLYRKLDYAYERKQKITIQIINDGEQNETKVEVA